MLGSYHSPILEWTITILLECVFLGFCVVFVGQGLTELRKKKDPLWNTILIGAGILMAVLSVVATIILLRGRA